MRAAGPFNTPGQILFPEPMLATLFNLGSFDFAARPGGLIYIGAYALTGVLAAFSVWWYRSSRSADAA